MVILWGKIDFRARFLDFPDTVGTAYQNNNQVVMLAYGFSIKEMTESERVAKLMKMYQALTAKQ